jgi:hypothetical protein
LFFVGRPACGDDGSWSADCQREALDRTAPIASARPLRQSVLLKNDKTRPWHPVHTPRRIALFAEEPAMMMVAIQPAVALIAGILILLVPRLLNYIVALYLIIVGIVGLWPHFMR